MMKECTFNFPHALYLDALDYGGTLRTGTLTLFGKDHQGAKEEYDPIIGYNPKRSVGYGRRQ